MLPDAGDIHWADLDPVLGSEQAGRRPVLVISPRSLHEVSRRALICPITSRMFAWTTTVTLPEGLRVSGSVLADQIRAVDRAARLHDFIERAPESVVAEVRGKLGVILGIL